MESGFQLPITIKDVINDVHSKKYLLPAIQREFVWKPEQVIKLFDSLMRGYPIGSFLFWTVDKTKVKDFQFYEFIREYHERDNTHNPKANVMAGESVTAILDGQQRLTALYIALRGSYSYKMPRMFWKSDHAFPKRRLYLNLLSSGEDFDMKYNFAFLTEDDIKNDDKNYWFLVEDALKFNDMKDIYDYLQEKGIVQHKQAADGLFALYDVLAQKKIINYYLETSQELDKVLNIFIRVNSGGTVLSYSDLLLSVATAQWKTRDAREEITSFVDEINRIGSGFNFDKDFVLKSALVLSDIKDVAFRVDNFNASNMEHIEKSWDDIEKSIRLAVELASSFGYSYETLTSNNALIPIAYYLMKICAPSNFILSSEHREDRERIKKWFMLSLLKRAFSGQPDNVLRPLRKIITDGATGFPLEAIVTHFKGTNKTILFTDEDIDTLLYSKYGQGHTFSVLALLYPTFDYRNRFHQDHMFPKSWFTTSGLKKHKISDEDIDFYLESYNYIANLQLLEGLPNEEKSDKDFKVWVDETYPAEDQRQQYMERHYIPSEVELDFSNFKEFFEKRNSLLKRKLKSILMI